MNRLNDFSPKSLGFNPIDEITSDLEIDVGIQQGQPHFAERFGDVFLGNLAEAAQILENVLELPREVIEHGRNLREGVAPDKDGSESVCRNALDELQFAALIMEKLHSLRLLLFVALAVAFPGQRAEAGVTNIVFDATTKQYNAAVGEMTAEFDFSLTNVSSSNITIRSVRASCGCTTPKLPALPWELAPGANGSFHVTVDLRGKGGTFQKTVSLDTSEGPKQVFVGVTIPQSAAGNTVPGMDSRTRNAQLAMADRQIVFKNDCATCHKPPSDMMGEKLFSAACGICHEADHRATSVPDLHALKAPPTEAYWEAWIRYGKVGTMMPAFAAENQGPLSDAQITSLVKFLANEFPHRAAKGATVHSIAPPPRTPQAAVRIPSVDDLKLGAPPVPPTPGS